MVEVYSEKTKFGRKVYLKVISDKSGIKMETRKAIIYARVSSSGYLAGRQTTERQVEALKNYAAANGYEVVRIFEEHISGASKNAEREQLNAAYDCAVAERVDMMLVSELSRVGRAIWEVLEFIKRCIDAGVNVYFQKENLTLFGQDGKVSGITAIYVSCLGFCAEMERENIRYRLNQGRELAKAKGVKMGRRKGSIKSHEAKAVQYAGLIRNGCRSKDPRSQFADSHRVRYKYGAVCSRRILRTGFGLHRKAGD